MSQFRTGDLVSLNATVVRTDSEHGHIVVQRGLTTLQVSESCLTLVERPLKVGDRVSVSGSAYKGFFPYEIIHLYGDMAWIKAPDDDRGILMLTERLRLAS